MLDAVERVTAAPADAELVVVAPMGAPVMRSAVFIDVLRRAAGKRRLAIVTPDVRARALAASVHVPAYASAAALERLEMDATERIDRPRRTTPVAPARPARLGSSRAWLGGVAAIVSLTVAVAAILLVPAAEVTVAPTTTPLGPIAFDVRAATGGDVLPQTLTATVTAVVNGRATGSRTEETKATGSVRLTNRTTNDVRVAKGTVFRTPNGVQFVSTDDRTIPRTQVQIFPPSVTFGTVDAAIEAVQPGPSGNVGAGRITVGPSADYAVENPGPTSGGETKRIPVVKGEDYEAAARGIAPALTRAADAQLARWVAEAREQRRGITVIEQVLVRQTGSTSPADVVDKEVETFQLSAAGTATAFAVPEGEPAAASLRKLRAAAAGDRIVDERAVIRADPPKIDESGVTWKVTASGEKYAMPDAAAIQTALAGRPVGDAPGILGPHAVRVDAVRHSPPWWPRLPFLPTRISVRVDSPAPAGR